MDRVSFVVRRVYNNRRAWDSVAPVCRRYRGDWRAGFACDSHPRSEEACSSLGTQSRLPSCSSLVSELLTRVASRIEPPAVPSRQSTVYYVPGSQCWSSRSLCLSAPSLAASPVLKGDGGGHSQLLGKCRLDSQLPSMLGQHQREANLQSAPGIVPASRDGLKIGRLSGRDACLSWRLRTPPSQRWYSSSAEGQVDIEVPFMGDSVPDGVIATMLKKPGDYVDVDEAIAQIETDKVTIDIRSPEAGVIEQIVVKEGDTVTPKTKVAVLRKGGERPADAKQEAAHAGTPQAKTEKAAGPTPAVAATASKGSTATPPSPAKPSATGGSPGPSGPQLASERGERRVKMTRLRQRVASRLKDAQNTFAMLTTFNEIDMTNLIELRNAYKDAFLEQHGVKLGFMSAFVKAAADALIRIPAANAVIDGDTIVYRDYVDISIAVATPKGLVVPVLKNVTSMGFADVEKNIVMLGEKAKDGSISIDDMAGGTFTISNGGVYGSLLSTPIINPPQSAILGMHSIQKRPVAIKDEVVIRPMMYVAVTYDHRLIDGREAVLFLRRIKDVIEDPRRLLLDC
ncbi:hypothetical protein CBR_g40253 [Chara braunii]|uniref:dihydrolipoyllysine-residue succinyltransferase n=1 Tax=Chara braunii TaxID=69332 RepID=A0A388K1T7_CHABU|nr:hypothetical protein CBR_g40253 [Chara braunii]|eukprot:GBG64008.1 hypothetical protein CBR_g40253 [Chara braunii]